MNPKRSRGGRRSATDRRATDGHCGEPGNGGGRDSLDDVCGHQQTSAPAAVVPCQVCGANVSLEVARLEIVNDSAYHRCPRCAARSVISWRDAIVLQVNPYEDRSS